MTLLSGIFVLNSKEVYSAETLCRRAPLHNEVFHVIAAVTRVARHERMRMGEGVFTDSLLRLQLSKPNITGSKFITYCITSDDFINLSRRRQGPTAHKQDSDISSQTLKNHVWTASRNIAATVAIHDYCMHGRKASHVASAKRNSEKVPEKTRHNPPYSHQENYCWR